MLSKTNGLVLRSIKYGDTSLVCTIFTSVYGVQTYMVKGVRTSKAKSNKAGMLQPATLLELVVYRQPQKTMEHIREMQPAYIYTNLQEEVVKNSIALFSVELLLRLLPEHAPLPELFDFCFSYFRGLDELPVREVANFPLYFAIQCSRYLGYEVKGSYTGDTPHLNMREGGYSANTPELATDITNEDAHALGRLLSVNNHTALKTIEMNAAMRLRLLHWYIDFLRSHTEHMGAIRSLSVLGVVLH